jgi:hypothetical protein
MNMKTLAVLVVIGASLSAFAADVDDNPQAVKKKKTELVGTASRCAERENSDDKVNMENKDVNKFNSINAECEMLKSISGGKKFDEIEAPVASMKGEIQCKKPAGYTLDFEPCKSAVAALNFVVNAEAAMDLQQMVRTDIKNKNIQDTANKQIATGDGQTGMFDASIESNVHQKRMQQEKAVAFSAAVAGLGATYYKWPSTEKLREQACAGKAADCVKHFDANRGSIVANESQKSGLIQAITTYIAKGVAAGIAMKQFDTKAKTVEAAKKTIEEETGDVMVARCEFNPTDPLCAKPGNRVSGEAYTGGDFSLGSSGNNSFDMGATDDAFGLEGDASTLKDETVAAVNSPFEDEAKQANGILDPAAAASMQAGNAAASGGSGGVGGGSGGGSASLGGDLDGADKDANKEASLKATKASGNYNAAGGSGFSAVKGGKADANPFASLFDAKSAGGIEEDRSIASGDIDGQASGLFQKISKRYGQIQADKRIEANNLE